LLGKGEFDQVEPKSGNKYVGTVGAVIDGGGVNRYAFTGKATNVTISGLTVRGFNSPVDEGVVNHDSGNGWVIDSNTLESNHGAALMAGARQRVTNNCIRNNGQYAMNAFQDGDGITGLLVEGNEIYGNNSDDIERENPDCGCSGGIKFWAVNGADVRENWIHDNRGPALWADTNNNDFLIENNVIENNDDTAVFYEISYNLVMRNNIVRNNSIRTGKEFMANDDPFPIGAVYLSEAGGEPRVKARTGKVDIYGNSFENNWGGVVVWENADRFCGSPGNTSSDYCTLLIKDRANCTAKRIQAQPYYSDCRWKSQHVAVHNNVFTNDQKSVGCHPGFAGQQAVLSNYGTVPEWSPYKGRVVQDAITYGQDNRWYANTYRGHWSFSPYEPGTNLNWDVWRAAPYRQDVGSTYDGTGC